MLISGLWWHLTPGVLPHYALASQIILQFFLAYTNEIGMLVQDRTLIARHYLSTWFPIDFLSILPFDMMGSLGRSIRLIRVLRLLKLARVLKASRMLARYEAKLSISYSALSMAKLMVMMIIVSHWVACLWGLLAELEGEDQHTWLKQAQADKVHGNSCDDEMDCPGLGGPVNQYAISLYFSVYTLTSVGYGDVSAQNRTEYFFASFLIAFAALFWAYTIGHFCSIVATSDQHAIHFHQTMDKVNAMLKDCMVRGKPANDLHSCAFDFVSA